MRHLFHTRAELVRLSRVMNNGLPTLTWQKVPSIVDAELGVPGEFMCRIDLAFQRPGKDQPMEMVAGRAPDRMGVMFFDTSDNVRSGDRVHCLDGPVQGTFEVRVMPDPAADYGTAHHMEVQIVEVSQNMAPNLLNRPEGSG